jgi:hypothetical protein
MKIFEHDGLFKASSISGPKHNYLGISFSEAEKEIELIEKEKQLSSDKKPAISVNKFDLKRVVRDAVTAETEKRGQQLFISKIEFVPTDSPDLFAYEELASSIAAYALEKRYLQSISVAVKQF